MQNRVKQGRVEQVTHILPQYIAYEELRYRHGDSSASRDVVEGTSVVPPCILASTTPSTPSSSPPPSAVPPPSASTRCSPPNLPSRDPHREPSGDVRPSPDNPREFQADASLSAAAPQAFPPASCPLPLALPSRSRGSRTTRRSWRPSRIISRTTFRAESR